MVKLINYPGYMGGCLWFEILDEIRQYAYYVSPPDSLNTVLFQRQNAVQHPV